MYDFSTSIVLFSLNLAFSFEAFGCYINKEERGKFILKKWIHKQILDLCAFFPRKKSSELKDRKGSKVKSKVSKVTLTQL